MCTYLKSTFNRLLNCSSTTSSLTQQRQHHQHRHSPKKSIVNSIVTAYSNNNNHNKNINNNIMGSANCKQYTTTTTKNDSCANETPDTGTIGRYHSKSEISTTTATVTTNTITTTNARTAATKMSDEYTEAVTICNVNDLQDNEMKQFDFIENTKLLLIKQNGKFSALGNKCTHYGAPMHTGTLGQGRVRCPWHGACFDIETGDIEDFPGLDSLPCYKVQVEQNGEVKVRAKRKDLESSKRLKDMVDRVAADERCYVVIGGGPSGAVCVETLRQEGFTGRIVFICREQNLPYDRIKISKTMDIAIETVQLRDTAFYEEHGIEALVGVEATRVDATARTVSCSNGFEIKFDKLYIATGCRASKPPIKGADLTNVVTVRDHADANAIHKLLTPEMHVVCLGASFIALEAAAYLVKKVKSVTLVGRENVPLKHSFGEKIGERVLELYKENNVQMVMNSGIEEIVGVDGHVQEVVLKDGSKIPCDLLVMGTGSRFYTDFLKESGVTLNSDGSIDTDEHLMTNIPDIYVGGDIANAPVLSNANRPTTIGHYQLAQYHGRVAALNMTGTVTDLQAVPFFFTMVFGKGFRAAGYGKFSDVHIDGDLANLKFAAYLLDSEGNVVSVVTCGRDPIVAQFAELQSQGKRLRRSDITEAADPLAWTNALKIAPCKIAGC